MKTRCAAAGAALAAHGRALCSPLLASLLPAVAPRRQEERPDPISVIESSLQTRTLLSAQEGHPFAWNVRSPQTHYHSFGHGGSPYQFNTGSNLMSGSSPHRSSALVQIKGSFPHRLPRLALGGPRSPHSSAAFVCSAAIVQMPGSTPDTSAPLLPGEIGSLAPCACACICVCQRLGEPVEGCSPVFARYTPLASSFPRAFPRFAMTSVFCIRRIVHGELRFAVRRVSRRVSRRSARPWPLAASQAWTLAHECTASWSLSTSWSRCCVSLLAAVRRTRHLCRRGPKRSSELSTIALCGSLISQLLQLPQARHGEGVKRRGLSWRRFLQRAGWLQFYKRSSAWLARLVSERLALRAWKWLAFGITRRRR